MLTVMNSIDSKKEPSSPNEAEAAAGNLDGAKAEGKVGGGEENEEGEEEDDDDENYFDVEKILDKRIRRKRWQYLVKWADLPESESTWEPRSNLKNCIEMVEAFDKEWLQKKLASKGGPGRGYTKAMLGGGRLPSTRDSDSEDDEDYIPPSELKKARLAKNN